MQKTQVLFMTLVSTLCLCTVMARSVSQRTKRTSSDQRVAEIQALLALEKNRVGHGDYDFDRIGKRKRTDDSYMMASDDDTAALYDDLDRLRQLQILVEAMQEYS